MNTKYCKNYIHTEDIVLGENKVLTVVKDKEGVNVVKVVDGTVDMSQYGSFTDWSLNSMIEAGINPESFSSPVINHTRLETANSVGNIDLTSLDTDTE